MGKETACTYLLRATGRAERTTERLRESPCEEEAAEEEGGMMVRAVGDVCESTRGGGGMR